MQTNLITIQDFYNDIFGEYCPQIARYLKDQNNVDIGHFNVFDIATLYDRKKASSTKPTMPYNRRTYYKISLIKGKNTVEYADKVITIDDYALLFATPRIPYCYVPQDVNQAGHFCVFTKDFLAKANSGMRIDELPIFQPNGEFIYRIGANQFKEVKLVFEKMHQEINSDYIYKYDLLRNYVMELIHYGQKLTPLESVSSGIDASARISTLFIELLERQFPISSPSQSIRLKSAIDYAQTLGVHVNHLNKVLKERTGKTTTEIIKARILQEARILLKQTPWNISEIAYGLGFEEVAHFSNFFKKNTNISPLSYRDVMD
ncbi:helix-turn-helix domain-containing protein [Sphingobacterium pedocola]|uniref:AraC family transcriptional regulator n=1 Tax=Sphingobacterium pedocola TaxID=2082722 RepID=A0ABR9T5Y8_9SPHI|nr:response regulator transcription factor [Sphingobacterium pedocola]MBE8720764.1 AraC family transcriptional regulator [Sphingobacterium pedocola]